MAFAEHGVPRCVALVGKHVILGVGCTLVIAWACAVFVDYSVDINTFNNGPLDPSSPADYGWSHDSDGPRWVMARYTALGSTRIASMRGIAVRSRDRSFVVDILFYVTDPGNGWGDGGQIPADNAVLAAPRWSRAHERPVDSPDAKYDLMQGDPLVLEQRSSPEDPPPLIEDGRGFPFRSLYCTFAFDPARDDWADDSPRPGFPLPKNNRPTVELLGSSHPRAIPMGIIWPGFMANVTIFASISLFLHVGWRIGLGVYRWTRSRCPRCGYQLDPMCRDRCSECGLVCNRGLGTSIRATLGLAPAQIDVEQNSGTELEQS